MTKLTEFYSQRAKKHWARDGDRNTTYFDQEVLKRRRRNTIVSIKDEHNIMHFNPDEPIHLLTTSDLFSPPLMLIMADHA
jgi:hypothetical protein